MDLETMTESTEIKRGRGRPKVNKEEQRAKLKQDNTIPQLPRPESYSRDLGNIFYLHNNEVEDSTRKQWAMEYLMTLTLPLGTFKALEKVDDFYFRQLGSLTRILKMGGILEEKELNHITRLTEELKDRASTITVPESTEQVAKPSVHDHIAKQSRAFIGEIDAEMDNYKTSWFSTASYLAANKVSVGIARFISSYFHKQKVELQAALDGTDPELVEAYRHLSKPNKKKMIEFMERIISDCQIYAKAEVKPRKKRKLNPVKVVSRMKYAVENKEFNLRSIDPKKILGAIELWTFNTKYRKLCVYKASSAEGLSIKGTTVQGFSDESTSKTLRKPEQILKKIGELTKHKMNKAFEEIKAKGIKLNGRINNETILLKVF